MAIAKSQRLLQIPLTSLHCFSLVWGESYCTFSGAPTPFCYQDFDLPFFDVNATFEEEIRQPRAKHANTLKFSASATILSIERMLLNQPRVSTLLL